MFFELLLTRRWALNNRLANPRTENTLRMLCVSFNLTYCDLITVKTLDFEICFLLPKLMISDVACSVVVASKGGCSAHYVTDWLAKVIQIRKNYNSVMELETSPWVLTSNRIILNYAGTCYRYCYMWQYACSKHQQRYYRNHAADPISSSSAFCILSNPDIVPLFVQPQSLVLYHS
jgi:hypothetical protein